MEPTREKATDNPPSYPVCASCGSDDVVCDAWAGWDPAKQEWELSQTFDDTFCRSCEMTGTITWLKVEETPQERTRRLNDEMRRVALTLDSQAYGTVVMTRGVAGGGADFARRAGQAVATFDAFDADNDPHGEHDFGALDLDGTKLFFKIDYYSLDMQGHSPDKSDVAVTHRVLTIMLASEY